jgi:glutamate dehydrogenase
MNLQFGVFPSNSPASGKLESLRSLLGSGREDLHELAAALFSRAPADYMERTNTESMRRITETVLEFYGTFLKSAAPFRVDVSTLELPDRDENVTAVCTAISDRPFIIDSLTETLSHFGLQHNVLLHPIVQHDGKLTSLVYLELPAISDSEVRQTISDEIARVFSHVLLVTDHFAPMLDSCHSLAHEFRKAASEVPSGAADLNEIAEFLRWLSDGNFVFLGSREWTCDQAHPAAIAGHDRGYFASTHEHVLSGVSDLRRDASLTISEKLYIHCSKSLLSSDVHRRVRLDTITVHLPKTSSVAERCATFVGMLTSQAASQTTISVPLIRKKVQEILEREGLTPNTHDYKEIISIADNIARDDLLRYSSERFGQEIALIFDLQRRDEVRVSSFLLPLHRFYSVNVVVPRSRYSSEVRQRIQHFLEERLGAAAASSQYHLTFTDYPLVVLRLLIPNNTLNPASLDLAECEVEIQEMTLTWNDRLRAELRETLEEHDAEELFRAYRNVFPEEYKAVTKPVDALKDIVCVSGLSDSHQLEASLSPCEESKNSFELKLFRWGQKLTLSGIVPLLENIGFDVEDEIVTSLITPRGDWSGIYNLRVSPRSAHVLDDTLIRGSILPGIKLIFSGSVENDPLNCLLLSPGLTSRQIALLRSILNYLWQIKASTSRESAIEALTENPLIARTLVELFEARFSPTASERETTLKILDQQFAEQIKEVPRLVHDRTLRGVRNIIEATVRTNYFQPQSGFRIAFKIDCARILNMPAPRPLVEIFVNSPDVEGVHLRGGRVARGGLRWSERKEDYRTEVLGLMKTQMVKNSIIVPVGAKGGFLVKKHVGAAPSRGEVECSYLSFVRSLLELTDNIIDGVQVPPPHTVCLDEPDPYLVVAADKGTATFSDIANGLATEDFNFWLGDAFASGGSNGYDHKKLGITARGAWESVTRHFREIGLDCENQDFTAVGIGDMSGDVFGNGMLLTDRIKLIAAFNHKHIFIDPTPDAKRTFAERERLFTVPFSQWSDYDASLISVGGAIYERSQKEITISEAAAHALGVTERVYSGESLIRAILMAPVDLLWNGGIGTYVKASDEEHFHVGDRANDDVRVDGRDLRAKVIGEGGNLGFTQKARIEYSKIGGHLNTDAVDNSGGVDLSDLEVNIKILLSAPRKRGDLSITDRNTLLESLAEECRQRIVARNRTQSRIVSLSVRRSRKNLGYYSGLVTALEHEGVLDRKAECLPDEETFEKRIALQAGLTRPELCVLIAYTRMTLKQQMLASSLPEQPFLQHFALNYFPVSLRERFATDIVAHPLKREIIATQAVNILLERMGASFVYRTAEETGAGTSDILSSFLVASDVLDAYTLTRELEVLDKASTSRLYLTTLIKISNALDGMTRWMLENRRRDLSLEQTASTYRPAFLKLAHETRGLLSDAEASRFDESCRQLLVQGLPKELAMRITSLSFATAFLDVVEIARIAEHDPLPVATLYSKVSLEMQVRDLLDRCIELEPSDRWESLALRSVMIELRRSIARITGLIIRTSGSASDAGLQQFLQSRGESLIRYRQSIRESSSNL